MSLTIHGRTLPRLMPAERYTVIERDRALWVYDRQTAQTVGEGYALRWPSSQRAARRFMTRLEREHQEASDG